MARTHPVDTIGAAIATLLRAARATYSPAQTLVEYDEFWQYSATKTKIDARLPGIFIQLDAGTVGRVQAGAQEGVVRYRINHLFKLTDVTNYPGQGTAALRKTLELLSDDDDFDLGIDAAGFELQISEPTEFGLSDELMEFGLGWAFVMIEITYTSLDT